MELLYSRWVMAEELGYKPKTTFWQDFSIADRFGITAIKDTFKRAFNEWKSDYIYLTELSMVLNHKSWQYQDNTALCGLYADLYYQVRDYALDNLTGDELSYYLDTTD